MALESESWLWLAAAGLSAFALVSCAGVAWLLAGRLPGEATTGSSGSLRQLHRRTVLAVALCVVAGAMVLASFGLLVAATASSGAGAVSGLIGIAFLLLAGACAVVLPIARRSLGRVRESLDELEPPASEQPPQPGGVITRDAA